ncbi:hypothetical protein [Nocardia australiensis]|uniref:hypothetical protein n=1 Tax=Nocardia australiensis TaxID=2887191 RepID=UPI001D1552A9|nr:hypothetical protein [Nocardia australiensis]
MMDWKSYSEALAPPPVPRRVTVSVRTVRAAIELVLMGFTRVELEVVLADELKLSWTQDDSPSDLSYSKRGLIQAYTDEWAPPQLIGLARRIVADGYAGTEVLPALLAEYDRGGGVGAPVKNLIFAANGPKPELVLRDAVNNDIQIIKNAEHCLVYDQFLPAEGLTFRHLIEWWRAREGLGDQDDRAVGLSLHRRLSASLAGNDAERLIFTTYSERYAKFGFGIPALIPQVYLHYDPYTLRQRGTRTGPLARQRMDFLLLFSDRQRVVIELDGRQHYADDRGIADPSRYATMMIEDRRLRLAGYEVYRFGGQELVRSDAKATVAAFFDALQERMR